MGLLKGLSCLVGCLPGLIVGSTYTLLIVTLWRIPGVVHYNKEFIIGKESNQINDPFQPGFDRARSFLKRQDQTLVRSHESTGNEGCGKVFLDYSLTEEGVEYLLLVLVHSSPGSRQERDSIRDTWLASNHHQSQYDAKFMVGLAGLSPSQLDDIACENKKFGDMILFQEINDTHKKYSSSEKLLQYLVWAEEHVQYKYLLKCTDRTFVNLEVILKELKQRESIEDYVWGFFAGGVQVSNEDHLKEPNWFLCSHYLPYPQGGGYVISKSVVATLNTLGPDLQHYVHDDIALGVWLSPFKGVEYFHDVRFNTGHYSRGCNNAYVVTHIETPASMRKKFVAVSGGGQLCEREQVFRPSYQYNWTVSADRCCLRKPGIP